MLNLGSQLPEISSRDSEDVILVDADAGDLSMAAAESDRLLLVDLEIFSEAILLEGSREDPFREFLADALARGKGNIIGINRYGHPILLADIIHKRDRIADNGIRQRSGNRGSDK